MRKVIILALLPLVCLVSCNVVNSLIHSDRVIAKVGSEVLYESELDEYIPSYVSPDDSANLAMQHIRSWALERIYMQLATTELSAKERDVTDELESYKRSLLKYRYEQRYVNDRLDTLVTEAQKKQYFESNQELFKIERPLVRARYIELDPKSKSKDKLLKLMASDRTQDMELVDSLADSYAVRYVDRSQEWVDVATLAKAFGIPYPQLIESIDDSYVTVITADGAVQKTAYISEIIYSGVAPLAYCEPRITDLIISSRKHRLLQDLERDLLTEASDRKKFVIY